MPTYTGSEFELQKFTVQLLELMAHQDTLWHAVPNGEYRSKRTGARLKATGVKPGVGDLSLCRRGRQHYLELKRRDGRLSTEQKDFAKWCALAGAEYAIARSPEEVRAVLIEWDLIAPAAETSRRAA